MASRNSMALAVSPRFRTSMALSAVDIGATSLPFDRARMLRQVLRQRRGQRTFGFFGSLFGGIKKIARTALSSVPGVGPALTAAQQILGGGRASSGFPLSVATQDPFVSSLGPVPPIGCPPGFINVDGKCVTEGARGARQRFFPGGETGLLVDEAGEAVMGAFGVPARVPMQVGTIMRRDGTVGPVLRCPRGAVLGIDELCYQKGTIDKKNRKWVPARKPPISAADWKAAQSIKRVQKGVKRVASASGLSCSKR